MSAAVPSAATAVTATRPGSAAALRPSSHCAALKNSPVLTTRPFRPGPGSGSESHVVVFHRKIVDADAGRRDPAGELARLVVRRHQPGHPGPVVVGGQPVAPVPLPLLRAEQLAAGAD